MRNEIENAFKRSKELRDEAELLLRALNGDIIDLTEWLTIKEYAKKFGKSDKLVYNWIRRGVVPIDNVRVVKELNNIRLIKAVPYKEV